VGNLTSILLRFTTFFNYLSLVLFFFSASEVVSTPGKFDVDFAYSKQYIFVVIELIFGTFRFSAAEVIVTDGKYLTEVLFHLFFHL